jgi:DNA-binding protein HU-beta
MTKADLIQSVAKQGEGMTKKAAAEMVDALFMTVGKVIKKEGRFSYPGFGTWTVRSRKARKGRNPQTGAEIKIKASKTVGFKPAKELKSGL